MKMKEKHFVTLTAAVCVCCVLGCGSQKRELPKDMPPLVACTLTVTQEGVPLAEAFVALNSAEPNFKWAVGGYTDDKGHVSLRTNGFFDGAPLGSYKVTVTKIVVTELADGKIKQTDVIDSKCQKVATTPLEVEIVKGRNEKTLDVGKAANVNVPVE